MRAGHRAAPSPAPAWVWALRARGWGHFTVAEAGRGEVSAGRHPGGRSQRALASSLVFPGRVMSQTRGAAFSQRLQDTHSQHTTATAAGPWGAGRETTPPGALGLCRQHGCGLTLPKSPPQPNPNQCEPPRQGTVLGRAWTAAQTSCLGSLGV